MEIKKCSICEKEYEGFGNNAEPINQGRCCDDCNYTKVIPKRIENIKTDETTNKIMCEECLSYFDEEDMDIHDEMWLCRECENNRVKKESKRRDG